jgi:hypothetical protein
MVEETAEAAMGVVVTAAEMEEASIVKLSRGKALLKEKRRSESDMTTHRLPRNSRTSN